MSKLTRWLAALSSGTVALLAAGLTAIIELVTVVLRFGFGLQSHTSTSWMAPLTLGLRIHHGYYGILMLLVAARLSSPKSACVRKRAALRNALVIVGAALFLSDMIHHFLVLWPITGSPEFYIRYD
jgi:hypothetical protein